MNFLKLKKLFSRNTLPDNFVHSFQASEGGINLKEKLIVFQPINKLN